MDLQNTPRAPEHITENRFYVEAVNFLSGKDKNMISTFPLSAEILILKPHVFFLHFPKDKAAKTREAEEGSNKCRQREQ